MAKLRIEKLFKKLEQLAKTGELIKLPTGALVRLLCVDTDK